MKYILLIYQAKDYNPADLSAEQHKAVADQYAAVSATPGVRPGPPLGLPTDAITVRSGQGGVTHARGPYIEQRGGSVGGYYEIDADSDDDAIRLASQIPAVGQGGAVEVRPSRVYW